jgi:TPP-dependent pyruvate/acetoin dehydrogenase alpha subunit
VEQELKLAEFKALYKAWKTSIPWLDHLLLGFLVWLEEKLIDARVKAEVDTAIEEYQKIEPPMPDMVTPVYTEKPSDTSTSLPEMRLTAPWYTDTAGTD